MRMCSVETRAEIAVAPLVRLFTLLPGQFRAFCFRFVKVACVGQAAAGCQGLRLCLWEDADFWKAYSEPCNGELPAAPASGSWDGFRKWLFHLDGKWIDSFRNMALQVGADHTQLFADAHYIASGLSRHDNSDDVEDLVDIILRLLLDYDAGQADHHNAAKALVTVVSSRRDVFSLSHIHRIAAMYDESLEQAILDRQGPVVGPHFNDHSQWHVWTHGPPLRSCQWHVGHAWGDPQHAWSAVAWQQPQDTRSGNAPSYASPWKKDLGLPPVSVSGTLRRLVRHRAAASGTLGTHGGIHSTSGPPLRGSSRRILGPAMPLRVPPRGRRTRGLPPAVASGMLGRLVRHCAAASGTLGTHGVNHSTPGPALRGSYCRIPGAAMLLRMSPRGWRTRGLPHVEASGALGRLVRRCQQLKLCQPGIAHRSPLTRSKN